MVHPVRTGPIVGLFLQIALLEVLASKVGLTSLGWATGIVYGLGVFVLLTHDSGKPFGAANWVTLIRACLVGCVTALVVDAQHRGVLVAVTILALVLDAVDGHVARRTGTATAFGARFDMEVDAFLIFVLSVYVASSMGWWVLAIGAMRYVWVIFSRVRPWLRGSLPPRYWRKVVAAIQGIVLAAAASGLLPEPLVTAALIGALALLVESFGRDIVWLWYQRPVEPLRQRLRSALPAAMKAGDRAAVSALRSTLAAIDNAEAVERAPSVDKHLAIELIPVGVGAAEMARRDLTDDDVEEIVRAELAEREAAVHELETAGRPELADDLRAQIRALATHLSH